MNQADLSPATAPVDLVEREFENTFVRELPGDRAPAGIAPAASVSTVAQPASFRSSCGVCHEDDLIRQQRLTRADWDREIDKMLGWGAKLKEEDRAGFLDYLSGNFGPHAR